MKIDRPTHILPRDWPELHGLGSARASRAGLGALAETNFTSRLLAYHSSHVTRHFF
jgi:hypothetical protein